MELEKDSRTSITGFRRATCHFQSSAFSCQSSVVARFLTDAAKLAIAFFTKRCRHPTKNPHRRQYPLGFFEPCGWEHRAACLPCPTQAGTRRQAAAGRTVPRLLLIPALPLASRDRPDGVYSALRRVRRDPRVGGATLPAPRRGARLRGTVPNLANGTPSDPAKWRGHLPQGKGLGTEGYNRIASSSLRP